MKTIYAKSFNTRKILTTALPYIGLVLVVLIFEVMSDGRLLAQRNWNTLINSCFLILIMSCGLVFLMAEGSLDLSVGGIMTVAAVTAAYSARVSIYLALPVALLCGLLFGTINGVVIGRLGVNGFIATLAMSLMLYALAVVMLNTSGIGIPTAMLSWNSQALRIAVMLIVAIVAAMIFTFTKFGKRCKAIGANELGAYYLGINIKNYRMFAYMISGGMAGLLAFMSLIRSGSATATTGENLEFNTLIALLIGGFPITGGSGSKYRAAIIGSITMTFLSVGMNMASVDSVTQQLIRGIVFLIIVGVTFERENTAVIK